MSDRMSVAEARTFATGYGTTMVNEVRAARTIVHQAEQIERLQNALREAIGTYVIEVSDLVRDGDLLPDDMEAPE